MPYASIFRSDLFTGQVGIVTGGGSGIGRCIAHELASLGATVVLASRDEAKLAAARAEIEADGGKADTVRCDIRSEAEVKALYERVLATHGKVDFVVNNGGGQFVSPAGSISMNGWRAVIETNLGGTFLMCREAYAQYMSDHGGAIVNIVAEMWRGMPMMAHSGAARAGVVNLTQTLALEWASAGIRVNAVAPGLILSSGFKRYPEMVQEALKSIPAELPFHRFGTESEVSAAVVFLLSPGARYVSGETMKVDGASSLYRHPFTLPAPDRPLPQFSGFHRPADVPEGLGVDE
ncbi:SDR family oxidoreductase [Myxococcota bacterium]|nr:SDR family oxidoreductase [Myxococcota bacterium]